jgi:hypothetical protein
MAALSADHETLTSTQVPLNASSFLPLLGSQQRARRPRRCFIEGRIGAPIKLHANPCAFCALTDIQPARREFNDFRRCRNNRRDLSRRHNRCRICVSPYRLSGPYQLKEPSPQNLRPTRASSTGDIIMLTLLNVALAATPGFAVKGRGFA